MRWRSVIEWYPWLLLFAVVFLFVSTSGGVEGFEGRGAIGRRRREMGRIASPPHEYALGPGSAEGAYALLGDVFPFIGGDNAVPDVEYQDVWWKYPVFQVGSYAQITNNLRSIKNPEDGQAMPSDFCGAFYGDRRQPESNYVLPLPPVPPGPGPRVGYFRATDREV